MSEQKWLKQWSVPSESGSKPYKVSLAMDGKTYVCHCWPFLRERTICKHIKKVLAGEVPEISADASTASGAGLPPEPAIELCNVREVAPVMDSGSRIVKVQTPLIPLGDTHFLLTVVHDLLKAGVRWPTLRERYRLLKDLTQADIEAYIYQNGRKIYGPWQEERGYVGYEIVR